jgi:hypothetical protein
MRKKAPSLAVQAMPLLRVPRKGGPAASAGLVKVSGLPILWPHARADAVKFGLVLWLAGFGFDTAATFHLDSIRQLRTPLAQGCDAAAMALMATGLVLIVRAASRTD